VDVVDPAKGGVERVPLEFDSSHSCQVCLALTPGADNVQVVAREGEEVVAWIEVLAQPGEDVTVEFRRDPQGVIRVFAHNKPFLILPDEEPPKPELVRSRETEELDIVVLVDGTCLHPADSTDNSQPLESRLAYLLAPESAAVWKDLAGGIAQFVARISASYPKVWAMAMAFGDEPMTMLANPLLRPGYLVHPRENQRKWQKEMTEPLADALGKLPHTTGGDFVDGLADGLHACAQVPWRQNSRKLLLVFGQSPGYSVLDAKDDMTDLLIRKACVEEEQTLLHRKGVEIVTVFHHPAEMVDRYPIQLPEVLQQAREQYRKLASLSEWSCTTSDPGLGGLAASWMNPPKLIARGPSPGTIVSGL
jgi:hypothetical protein